MRILFVVHGFPPSSTGGTEIYACALATALKREGHDLFVLAREARPDLPELGVRRESIDDIPVVRVNNTFRAAASFAETYRNATVDAIAGRLIDELAPDVVHAHHLTCLSTGIIEECVLRDVPVVLTLHDYWLFCHRGQLLDLELARCAGPDPERCAVCAGLAASSGSTAHKVGRALRSVEARAPDRLAAIQRRVVTHLSRHVVPPTGAGELTRRLEEARAVCGAVTRLLAPSRTALEQFVGFGVPASRLVSQQQGIDLRLFAQCTRRPSEKLRLGFIGSLMPSKAPHVLLEAFADLPHDRVSLTIAGGHAPYHGDDSYASRLRSLLASSGAAWLDQVTHEQVPSILSALDVLVVPSVWIENAPLVIREAFAAGVPVVASDLGGMAEMVCDGRDGLLFRAGDAADLKRVLSRFLDEPALLARLQSGIRPVRSIEEDAAWTLALYEGLQTERRRAVPTKPLTASVIVNYETPDDTVLAVRSLQASRRRVAPLIVVDNGSDARCERALAPWKDSIQLIRTGANLGFTGGSNAGMRAALASGAELILLVNSDAVVAPDTIGRLQDALASDPDAGIAAPLIVSRSEPGIVGSAGIHFSPRTGRMRHQGYGRRAEDMQARGPSVIEAASGCAMLIRRAVLEAIGLFDDRYFFSFEDIDLCWRARQVGWKTLLVPSAVAYHEGHRSIGAASADRLYFAARNHQLLAERAGPATRLSASARSMTILLLNLAYAVRAPGVSRSAAIRAVVRGTLDHVRGRYGPSPLAGR
jgi:GT2 family glycosyltransferase/glycosyltransferase involved in cell wall biosynthesis